MARHSFSFVDCIVTLGRLKRPRGKWYPRRPIRPQSPWTKREGTQESTSLAFELRWRALPQSQPSLNFPRRGVIRLSGPKHSRWSRRADRQIVRVVGHRLLPLGWGVFLNSPLVAIWNQALDCSATIYVTTVVANRLTLDDWHSQFTGVS